MTPEIDYSQYMIALPPDSDLPLSLRDVREKLEARVIGQPLPIRRLMRGITTFYAGLNDPNRPIGVFLFAGPSGSGKTYFAQELAYALIGEPNEEGLSPLVTIDCGSLSLEHTVASLTGSPPGYVGYGERVGLEQVGEYDKQKRGLERLDKKIKEIIKKAQERLKEHTANQDHIRELINILRYQLENYRNQYEDDLENKYGPFRSVVLFDEIEKADMNIQSQLLSILDEGGLTLLNGRVIDFRASIIILTTNVGTEQILAEHLDEKKIGFSVPDKEEKDTAVRNLNQKIYRRVLEEILDKKKRYFKPELLGRIGKQGIIVFNVLSYRDYQKILDLQLQDFMDFFIDKEGNNLLSISYTQGFKDFLIEEGVSPVFGARALRNVIDKYVRVPIAEKILTGELVIGDNILLDIQFNKEKDGYTVIARQERPAGKAEIRFEMSNMESFYHKDIDKFLDDYLENFLKPLKM
ncbi:MAG: ATP-dependent Clp protease ATP-binding subunit [Candidatus Nealsonbacteria bacterium]|nr:ATP-dependent Clp protease ATP-binding subunit [Candidatus Nealsonbacteria bacterium]